MPSEMPETAILGPDSVFDKHKSSATSSAFLLASCRPGRRVDCDIFNRSALHEVIIRFAYGFPSVMSGTGIVVAADWVPKRTWATVGKNGLKRCQDVDE